MSRLFKRKLGRPTKTTVTAVIVFSLLLSLTSQTLIAHASDSVPFLGLSGYVTSTANMQNIIDIMNSSGLNIYRISFNPEWYSSKPDPYNPEYIQFFLDNCNYTIIIDRNHLYPPNENSASAARSNWQILKNSLFEVLERWPNNSRVMVELINEYVSTDFYSRMQSLVTEIRAANYTNTLVVNKFSQSWATINDPLDNTYQGYHYYFNSWSVSYAISNAKLALSKGIKLINTEVGADYREHGYYTTYTVDELDSFLSQCESLGVSNLVWMNEDLNNWSSYQYYELTFPGAPLAESSTLYQVNLQSEKEDNATSNLGSIVFGGTNYSLPGLVSMELGDCSLTYSPSSGYVFDHWVLNGSAAIADSKSQSTTVSVSGNCTVKATYTQVADQHILHVEVRGTGTTNATGDTSYIEGTVVSVNASASSGWTLSHWLLDNLNVGSANPYSVAVDNDRNLTAVFMQVPFTYLFSDGFESNSFSSWSSTTTTSGDSVKTSNTHPYGGSFEAQFYTTGNTKSRENACLRKNVNLQSINASGFFSFSSSAGRSLLSDNGDKLYLIRLSSSKGDIALAGIIRENGVYKWLLYTNGAVTSSAIPIATDQYYSVALRWNSVQRTAEMYVNGVRTLGRITNTYSVVSRVDMGIINTFSIQYPLWVYGDNFTITN